MSRWFRMYDDLLDDPKVQRLDPVLFKTWVNLLCLASKNDGKLPQVSDIAFALRLDDSTACLRLEELKGKGLIDAHLVDGYQIHNWDKRQNQDNRPPANVWRELRGIVFTRDDYTCAYCGERAGKLECDHVTPVSRGGSNDIQNLVTTCKACNRSKRNKLVSEWIR